MLLAWAEDHAAGTFGGKVAFELGDMAEVLARYPENHFDSCVCDPPYHLQSIVDRFGKTSVNGSTQTEIRSAGRVDGMARMASGFMGKTWDGGDVAFRKETWGAVLRVLKPGAYIVAFSATRTYHRMACAIEDAGFITHPMFGWIFGQGFPKATRIDAEGFDGFRYGAQAFKPALEPVYFGQKPFSEKTGTKNILHWGTGAVNIDGCRIGFDSEADKESAKPVGWATGKPLSRLAGISDSRAPFVATDNSRGRWPANLIHDGSDEVIDAFPQTGGGDLRGKCEGRRPSGFGNVGSATGDEIPNAAVYADKGSAARFFYAAKSSSAERAGSKHPTIKPLSLIRYLTRAATPPGGLVLDPFAGSGTTGEAAVLEGMRAVLIDLNEETFGDLVAREQR